MKKAFVLMTALLVMGFNAFSAEIMVQSDAVPTCYERSNTALLTAIKNAEQKAEKKCSDPILVDLQTEIVSRNCGLVQVRATYECNF